MKVIRDSVIYLGGELFSKSIPFLLLPYLSRKLGVEGYGELSYYQTFLVLFLIIFSLSQEGAVARYLYFYGRRSLNIIVNAGYSYTILMGIITVLISYLLKSVMLTYVAISVIFQSLFTVQLSVRQCQKKALAYITIQLIFAITSAITAIAFLEIYDFNLVEKRILAILVANLITFFISYFLYIKDITYFKKFRLFHYKLGFLYIIGFGFPLLLHHVSIFLKGQLDRIFIYHAFSEYELGLYSMGVQLAAISLIFVQAINKATLPYLFDGIKQNKINLRDIHKWFMLSLLLIPIPIIFVFFIPEGAIVLLLGDGFYGTKHYLITFLSSAMLSIPYLILVNYIFFYGKNKIISFCSVISSGIYIVLLLVLVKVGNITYIPYASVISSICILPILYFQTKRISGAYVNK